MIALQGNVICIGECSDALRCTDAAKLNEA